MSVAIETMSLPASAPEIESPTSVRRLTAKDAAILFDYQQTHNLTITSHPHLSSPQTLCLLTTPNTGLLIVTLECKPPTLLIKTLHIDPTQRRKGLASVMLDQARTWAGNTIGRCHRRDRQGSQVAVVVEDYEEAHEFWDQMGFHGGRGVIQLA